VGSELPTTYQPAARAVADLREVRFPGRVKGVQTRNGEATLTLQDGRVILLGEPSDLLLKVAVAGQILRRLHGSLRYVDVSVPERPVASANLQPSS
jgi:hypothetical protein